MTLRPRPWHFGLTRTRFWPAVGWAALGLVLVLRLRGDLRRDRASPTSTRASRRPGRRPGHLRPDRGRLHGGGGGARGRGVLLPRLLLPGPAGPLLGAGRRPLINGLLFGAIHDFARGRRSRSSRCSRRSASCSAWSTRRPARSSPCIALHAFNNSIAYGVQTDGDGAGVGGRRVPMIAGVRGRARASSAPAPHRLAACTIPGHEAVSLTLLRAVAAALRRPLPAPRPDPAGAQAPPRAAEGGQARRSRQGRHRHEEGALLRARRHDRGAGPVHRVRRRPDRSSSRWSAGQGASPPRPPRCAARAAASTRFRFKAGKRGNVRLEVAPPRHRHARRPCAPRTSGSRSCASAAAPGASRHARCCCSSAGSRLGFATPGQRLLRRRHRPRRHRLPQDQRHGPRRATPAAASSTCVLQRPGRATSCSYPKAGKHVEFDWSRQVLVLADKGRAVARLPLVLGHARHARPSSAPSASTARQPGTNAKGMVHSSYFIGGYAIHGYASVPNYPASHGCLRVPIPNASRSSTGSSSASGSSSTASSASASASASASE